MRFTSIDRSPPAIRELIAQRRREARTIEGIRIELLALGFVVSKSTIGRHTKGLDAIETAARRAGMAPVLAELRRCRAALEALCDHFGAARPTI